MGTRLLLVRVHGSPQGEPLPVVLRSADRSGLSALLGSDLDCDVVFDRHPLLSPRHASISMSEGNLWLEDLGSEHGTYIRLRPRQLYPLPSGARLIIGSTKYYFVSDRQAPPAPPLVVSHPQRLDAHLVELLPNGRNGDHRHLFAGENTLGRASCNTIPVAGDVSLSRVHIKIQTHLGGFLVADWGIHASGSTTGTYLEILNPTAISPGDTFQIGNTRLRLIEQDRPP